MRKCRFKHVMVTFVIMRRFHLITKEKRDNFWLGNDWFKESINNDTESFIDGIILGQKPDEFTNTYFLPKLNEEEMKLVARKDSAYLKTFEYSNPDVEEAEMASSESDSKFCLTSCYRRTITCEYFDPEIEEYSLEDSTSEESLPKKIKFELPNWWNFR